MIMSLTLTIILSLLSAAILAGRVYEILMLTDATGFLVVGGVVLNPYIIGIFAVITLCCGIIIFGGYTAVKPYYSNSSKYTAFIAGLAMAVAGILALPYKVMAPFYIACGLALLVMAGAGLGKRKSDWIVMILMLAFTAGLCMDVVTFNVSTYHNTAFLQNVLSYICIVIFIISVLKNVYMPAKFSRMMLYVSGILCFASCSMMSLADIICYIIQGGQSLVYLLTKIAFALFGLYAFDTAVSAIPSAKELQAEKRAAAGIKIIETSEENTDTAEMAQEETVLSEQEAEEYKTENCGAAISENEILQHKDELTDLFERLASEKTDSSQQLQEDIGTITEEAVLAEETEEDAGKYNTLSEIFAHENSAEIKTVHSNAMFETRSFKKVVEPKLSESAPEYDMLKSMFRGEDTSDFEFNAKETEKEANQPESKAKKRSVFGGDKKEKAPKEKVKEPKAEKGGRSQQPSFTADKKIKFVSAEPRQAKTKTETKKVVYKKPK